jgi:hypothetical protein
MLMAAATWAGETFQDGGGLTDRPMSELDAASNEIGRQQRARPNVTLGARGIIAGNGSCRKNSG